MDWLPWVIRAVLIIVGIIVAIIIWKREKEGRYQGRYYFQFFVIGTTAFLMGVILLIVSLVTDLSLFFALYLIAAGAISLIIGLVIRYIWKKNH